MKINERPIAPEHRPTKRFDCSKHGQFVSELVALPIPKSAEPFWTNCPACVREFAAKKTYANPHARHARGKALS
jgi:hypothetical protein